MERKDFNTKTLKTLLFCFATCFFLLASKTCVYAQVKFYTRVDQEVVVDDNLVTSRKPEDIPAFNREMLELFGRYQARRGGGRARAAAEPPNTRR